MHRALAFLLALMLLPVSGLQHVSAFDCNSTFVWGDWAFPVSISVEQALPGGSQFEVEVTGKNATNCEQQFVFGVGLNQGNAPKDTTYQGQPTNIVVSHGQAYPYQCDDETAGESCHIDWDGMVGPGETVRMTFTLYSGNTGLHPDFLYVGNTWPQLESGSREWSTDLRILSAPTSTTTTILPTSSTWPRTQSKIFAFEVKGPLMAHQVSISGCGATWTLVAPEYPTSALQRWSAVGSSPITGNCQATLLVDGRATRFQQRVT